MTHPDLGLYHTDDTCYVSRDGPDDLIIRLAGFIQPAALPPWAEIAEQMIGPIERTISTRQQLATHHRLQIPAAWRGQGRGRAILASSVKLYRALGVERVRLTAVDEGRYVWAMAGFDFARDDDRQHVMDRGRDFCHEVLGIDVNYDGLEKPWEIGSMDQLNTSIRLLLDAYGVDPPSGVPDERLDAPIRLGKALLLFSRIEGWEGVMDITDNSPCYEQLISYTSSQAVP